MIKKVFETTEGTKQATRVKIVSKAREFLGTPRCYFTLPGRCLIDVELMKSEFPGIQCIGVERNPTDFQYISKSNLLLSYNCTIKEYASASFPGRMTHHDVVWFDFFSHFSEDTLSDAEAFFSNRSLIHEESRCLFALTLSKAIRHNSQQVKEEILEVLDDVEGDAHSNIPLLVADSLLKVGRKRVKLVHEEEYQAQQKSMPMLFYIFETE